MTDEIASAFQNRERPANVTDVIVNSTLRDDALHFEGMDWSTITASDWKEYSDAYSGLNPQAFIYFLPSLLIASLEPESQPVVAADALVYSLDTSGDPDLWTEWFNERFMQLIPAELRVVKNWATSYLADAENGYGSEFERVQQTLDLLIELAG